MNMVTYSVNLIAFVLLFTVFGSTTEAVALPKDSIATIKYDFTYIDSVARNVPKDSCATIESLVSFLNARSKNDLEKVRSYYVWLADNIVYDMETFLSTKKKSKDRKPQDAEPVFKERLGVCAGYSALFRRMCNISKIENRRVSGFADPFSRTAYVKVVTDSIGHAWNAVRLNGGWGLIDATWAAGHTTSATEWKEDFNPNWFLSHPEMFAMSHTPYSSMQMHNMDIYSSSSISQNASKLTPLDTLLYELPSLPQTLHEYVDSARARLARNRADLTAYTKKIQDQIETHKQATEAKIKAEQKETEDDIVKKQKENDALTLQRNSEYESFFDKVTREQYNHILRIALYNDSVRMAEDSLDVALRDKTGSWMKNTTHSLGSHGSYKYTVEYADSSFTKDRTFRICVNSKPILFFNVDSVEKCNEIISAPTVQMFHVSNDDKRSGIEHQQSGSFEQYKVRARKSSEEYIEGLRSSSNKYIAELQSELKRYTAEMTGKSAEYLGQITYPDRKLLIKSQINSVTKDIDVALLYRGHSVFSSSLDSAKKALPIPQASSMPAYLVVSDSLDKFYGLKNYDAFKFNHEKDVVLYDSTPEVVYREAEYLLEYELGYDLDDIDDEQRKIKMDAKSCENQNYCFLTPAVIGVDDLIPKHRKAYAILKKVVDRYEILDPDDEPAEMEAAEEWLDIVEDWLDDNDPTWDN